MTPAALTRICPICTQALASPAVYHPVGKDHPMHVKCLQLMMKTMKECPVCTQSTDSILEGLQIKNAFRLTSLDALERLNELNEQVTDEKELIEGFDNLLMFGSSNENLSDESLQLVRRLREEAVQRCEALLSEMRSLTELMHAAKWILDLAENTSTYMKDGRPYLAIDDHASRKFESGLLPQSSEAKAPRSSDEQGRQEKPSHLSSPQAILKAFSHLGSIATKQQSRRQAQLDRVNAAIKDIHDAFDQGSQILLEMKMITPGVSELLESKAKLEELTDCFLELEKLEEIARAQKSVLFFCSCLW